MCGECLKTVAPDRGTTCLEKGCYFLNFKGCASCNRMDTPTATQSVTGMDDGEEEITFTHLCKHCNHEIAKHTYTFRVEDGFQEYSMVCKLCGRGSDTISVLPNDPRRGAPLF
eukprot:m.189094 g.189094  ORF g.189094 m.189094 type:complete len:113 (-) comp17634_c0_seq1:80-418(-)